MNAYEHKFATYVGDAIERQLRADQLSRDFALREKAQKVDEERLGLTRQQMLEEVRQGDERLRLQAQQNELGREQFNLETDKFLKDTEPISEKLARSIWKNAGLPIADGMNFAELTKKQFYEFYNSTLDAEIAKAQVNKVPEAIKLYLDQSQMKEMDAQIGSTLMRAAALPMQTETRTEEGPNVAPGVFSYEKQPRKGAFRPEALLLHGPDWNTQISQWFNKPMFDFGDAGIQTPRKQVTTATNLRDIFNSVDQTLTALDTPQRLYSGVMMRPEIGDKTYAGLQEIDKVLSGYLEKMDQNDAQLLPLATRLANVRLRIKGVNAIENAEEMEKMLQTIMKEKAKIAATTESKTAVKAAPSYKDLDSGR